MERFGISTTTSRNYLHALPSEELDVILLSYVTILNRGFLDRRSAQAFQMASCLTPNA